VGYGYRYTETAGGVRNGGGGGGS